MLYFLKGFLTVSCNELFLQFLIDRRLVNTFPNGEISDLFSEIGFELEEKIVLVQAQSTTEIQQFHSVFL